MPQITKWTISIALFSYILGVNVQFAVPAYPMRSQCPFQSQCPEQPQYPIQPQYPMQPQYPAPPPMGFGLPPPSSIPIPQPIPLAVPAVVPSLVVQRCQDKKRPVGCPPCPPCFALCVQCIPSFFSFCSPCHQQCRCREGQSPPIPLPPPMPQSPPGPGEFPLPIPPPGGIFPIPPPPIGQPFPPPVMIVPFPPPMVPSTPRPLYVNPYRYRRPKIRLPGYSDVFSDSDSSSSSSFEVEKIKHKRRKHRRQQINKEVYLNSKRRNHQKPIKRKLGRKDYDRQDTVDEDMSPILSYMTKDGNVMYRTKVSNVEALKLLGARETELSTKEPHNDEKLYGDSFNMEYDDQNQKDTENLRRNLNKTVKRPSLLIITEEKMKSKPQKKKTQPKGSMTHRYPNDRKEMYFKPYGNKTITNLTVTFDIL